MSVTSANIGGDFRVGSVLSRAAEICGANFPLFGVVMLIVSLPNLYFTLQTPETDPTFATANFLLASVIGLFLSTIGEAFILIGAFQYLRGQPVVPSEALQRSVARFLPIVGFAILYAIALLFGFLLLIVPGIIFLVMWTVALPACVVEGLGPVDCMRRSAELTKGHRWKILGIIILLAIISGFINWILGMIAAQGGVVVKSGITLIWTAAWSAYWNCVLVMIYHDLRVVKEGVDTDQIASIFD